MFVQKPEVTKEQVRQHQEKCDRFAAGAADAIGAAGQGLFSLLPYEERVRLAASWYDACTHAMLRGNYALLDEWIRGQACAAAAKKIELEDLLQLLRIFRRSAIQIDGWDEDIFSAVDDVINEALLAIRPKVSWTISDDLNYLKKEQSKPALRPELIAPGPVAASEVRDGERREFARNRLALPIRVRCSTKQRRSDEITSTQNVSLSGFYFKTQENYPLGSPLLVTYPYWTGPGGINKEYSARVTRLDRLPDRSWGVAAEFLRNLRNNPA